MPFTRMDQGKIEEWMFIGRAVAERQSGMSKKIKAMLLEMEEQVDGFAINQLGHGLQTATRALRRDQTSFDPGYDTLPLSHFEPMLDRVYAQPRREMALGA